MPNYGNASGSSATNSAGLGGWERHTKGIGSRLLEKMGYKPGQGLGKNNEGIVNPVKLQANKSRSMLGFETDEREHRRREKATRLSKRKGLPYDSDEEDNDDSSNEDIQSDAPKFVQDDQEQDKETDIDEDSPQYIARQLIASNAALIQRLKEEQQAEEAKRSMLEQTLADYQRDLQLYEDLIKNYRDVLNLIQHLETINRSDKLDLNNFWSFMSPSISPQVRCYMIQAFAVPLISKTYNKLAVQNRLNQVHELELEQKLFHDIIDVAREWLKTKSLYDKLIEWYLEWSKLLTQQYPNSKRIEHFRRKLLDVMFLATIRNERDLNSFRYIAYNPDGTSADSGQSHPTNNRSSSAHQDSKSSSLNFKQLIEQTASENGLMLRPVSGRTHESKQVYKLEKLNIYIDNRVIFVKQNDRWLPKTLGDVINMSFG